MKNNKESNQLLKFTSDLYIIYNNSNKESKQLLIALIQDVVDYNNLKDYDLFDGIANIEQTIESEMLTYFEFDLTDLTELLLEYKNLKYSITDLNKIRNFLLTYKL